VGYKLHYNPSTGTISYWPKLGVSSFTGVVDAGGLDITWPASKLYTSPATGRIDMDAGSGTCADNTTNYLIWSSGMGLALGTTEPSDAEILASTITTSGGDITDITAAELIVRVLHIMSTRTEWKLFRVVSEATGDGLYICRFYNLDATDWANEAGNSKLVADADDSNKTVLNLAEFNPESEYVQHLSASDLIFATQVADDEDNDRWIGVPFGRYGDRTRTAFCNGAPTGTSIAAFLDKDTTGTSINVKVFVAGTGEFPNSSVNLNTCIPPLQDGDPIPVHNQCDEYGHTWYCDQIFTKRKDCICSV